VEFIEESAVNKYIVITTISEPTEATIKFSQMPGWQLIVVGDQKTPHESYKHLNCAYLSPEYQEQEYKELSDIIGWNTSARRNIGFIEAYRLGADILALSDDDNIPYDNWGKEIHIGQPTEVDYYEVEENEHGGLLFDPLSVTNFPSLWHRGFPINEVARRNPIYKGRKVITPLVQANLWDGDPDIDAIERLILGPKNFKFNITQPYASNGCSPFNSQNTILDRSIIPHFMLLPNTGRLDDIWGSYLAQSCAGKINPFIIYDKATVYQERNPHNLAKDLRDELIGYEAAYNFPTYPRCHDQFIPQQALNAYKIYKKVIQKYDYRVVQ
jgi:hypothetical protein